MIRLCTWNVNGLRACIKNGFLPWFEMERPDVLSLQETKASPDQLPNDVTAPAGYHAYYASAVKKGYSGVALFCRTEPRSVEIGLGIPEFDNEGRTIVADLGDFVFIGSYFPNSQDDLARLPYKLAYNAAILERINRERAAGREVVICGDFNAAHTPIDLRHPKPNDGRAGYHPDERAWVTQALETGLVDVFRQRHPNEKDHYTWWSYFHNARKNNAGWRIDYFLTTPGIVPRVRDVKILSDVMGSDHCPVRLEIE